MTDEEIVGLVQDFWVENIGTAIQPVGFWLTWIKNTYDEMLARMYASDENDEVTVAESRFIEILTYIWGCALQYDTYITWDSDPGASSSTQTPKLVDLDELCLDVSGMSWNLHQLHDCVMMLGTYIQEASNAWESDVSLWYTLTTSNNIRKAAQTIRQYFNNWG